jgi:hypothetical protein
VRPADWTLFASHGSTLAMRRRKPHPADLANAALIERADHFEIALFLGTGVYARARAATQAQARDAARALKRAHPDCSRQPIIYAIDANGRSAILPTEQEIPMPKKAATKTKARKAAKTKAPVAKKAAGRPKAPRKAAQAPASRRAAAEAQKPLGKRAAIMAAARAGELPMPPNFEAATHERFRPKLAELVKLAKAGDVAGLRAFPINPISSSPKAMARYRDLCMIAIEAKAKRAAA